MTPQGIHAMERAKESTTSLASVLIRLGCIRHSSHGIVCAKGLHPAPHNAANSFAHHTHGALSAITLVQPVNSSIFAARRSCPCPFKGKGPNPSKRSKWGCHYSVVRFGQDYSWHRIAGRCVVFSIVVSGLIVFITIL